MSIGNQLILKRSNSHLSVGMCETGLNHSKSKRGSISNLSTVSTWRMVSYLKSAVSKYSIMVTLTYPKDFTNDGVAVKKDLDRFLRRISGGQESILWFLEFQKRGAPHFHLFLTDFVDHKKVAAAWAWATGEWHAASTMTRTERLRSAKHGLIAYAIKYAAKSDQKTVPEEYRNVGRFWGVRGCARTWGAVTRCPAEQGGDDLYKSILALLDEAVSTGKLKKIEWKYGSGHYFQLVDRSGEWYSHGESKKLELLIQKHHIEWGSPSCIDKHIPFALETRLEGSDFTQDQDQEKVGRHG